LCPSVSFGLGYDEFILFGMDQQGREVNLTGSETEDSPVRKNDQIVGIRKMLTITRNAQELSQGRSKCELMFDRPTLVCEKGEGFLSGAIFKGHEILNSAGKKLIDIERIPTVKNLYAQFLKKYEYGELSSYFQCEKNCPENLPRTFILVWRGD
jgi:hypothetical protein